MWGALSPTQHVNRSLAEELATAEEKLKAEAAAPPKQEPQPPINKRNIGQAEIESSLYKVMIQIRRSRLLTTSLHPF